MIYERGELVGQLRHNSVLQYPGLRLSGPDALLGLRLVSNFRAPEVVICIFGIDGAHLGDGVMNSVSFVNTLWNCLFKASALSFCSLISLPSTFKQATPLRSVVLHFMNFQKRFILEKLLGSDS